VGCKRLQSCSVLAGSPRICRAPGTAITLCPPTSNGDSGLRATPLPPCTALARDSPAACLNAELGHHGNSTAHRPLPLNVNIAVRFSCAAHDFRRRHRGVNRQFTGWPFGSAPRNTVELARQFAFCTKQHDLCKLCGFTSQQPFCRSAAICGR